MTPVVICDCADAGCGNTRLRKATISSGMRMSGSSLDDALPHAAAAVLRLAQVVASLTPDHEGFKSLRRGEHHLNGARVTPTLGPGGVMNGITRREALTTGVAALAAAAMPRVAAASESDQRAVTKGRLKQSVSR